MHQDQKLTLNIPQSEFLAITRPFRAFVGGYRSGKTFIGCVRLCILALAHPGIKLGYFAPTYPQIRDIFYDTISLVAEMFGMTISINQSNHEVSLTCDGVVHAVVKCRSMEHPHRIVGFDINHALVDEIDCMKISKADAAWKKIVARLSTVRDDYPTNTVDFTTTPEGFNWVYKFFVTDLKNKPELRPFYGMVKASTRKNAKNLPADYIPKLYATYSKELVNAYIEGEFVNLTAGTVYHQFSRTLNNCNDTIQGDEPLFIGMDFNVTHMACVIHVKRDGNPRAVEEIVDGYDTEAVIRIIKERYCAGNRSPRSISIYPDASGDSRKSVDASKTDISILKQAGFTVKVNPSNPAVKDRINAMNAMFCNADNERRYLVNVDQCPVYADCLEQQIWGENGEPDKKAGNDHQNDAGGYVIIKEYPIKRPMPNLRGLWK